MRLRLVRKLADTIDGVDISTYAVGDVIDVDRDEARLLIAEKWAVAAGTAASAARSPPFLPTDGASRGSGLGSTERARRDGRTWEGGASNGSRVAPRRSQRPHRRHLPRARRADEARVADSAAR